MPDITTTEGRQELRRLIPPHGSKDIQDWAHPALDGLDIAQMAMRATSVENALLDMEGRAFWWPGFYHWWDVAADVFVEAQAEWDKWQEG